MLEATVLIEVECNGTKKEIVASESETILEASLRAGIPAPYSCKSGACQACRGILSSGEVIMMSNDVLSDEEVKSGQVLCCQAKPKGSARVVVKFLED